MDFRSLLDVPTALDADSEDVAVSEHPVARLGAFRDARYGRFKITREMYESWVRNLEQVQNGRVAIDYDHLAERAGGTTKAAGWITSLRLDGDKVMARIEWTPEGAEAVRNRYYLFVSPSFVSDYTDEQGAKRGPALLGVALTNRPFLQREMPALSLSREMEGGFAEADEPAVTTGTSGKVTVYLDGVQAATATATDHRDSPPRMAELSKIAEALSLSADADEDAILAAVAEATKEPEAPKTLSEQAEAEDKVVLDKTDLATLTADAKAGREAKDELFNQGFELAYDKALTEVRVTSDEDTKAEWKALYDAAPDVTLKRLAALPKVANTEGHGSGNSGEAGDAPDGFDEESFELDRKVKAYIAEHPDTDYVTALDKVLVQV